MKYFRTTCETQRLNGESEGHEILKERLKACLLAFVLVAIVVGFGFLFAWLLAIDYGVPLTQLPMELSNWYFLICILGFGFAFTIIDAVISYLKNDFGGFNGSITWYLALLQAMAFSVLIMLIWIPAPSV